MQPVIATIGSFNVYSFGLFLSIAFLFSTFIVWKLGKEEFKEELYLDLYFYSAVVSLFSARITYAIFHFDEFRFNILRYILIRETPGLSLLGGALGGCIFLFILCRRKKLSFFHVIDMFSVAASVAATFGKIGEQLGGGVFGRETTFILGVRMVGSAVLHHPVELYEAVVFLFLSIVLYLLYTKPRKTRAGGSIFYLFAVSTLLAVFILEFFKSYPVYLYGLSLRQIIALGGVIILSFGALLKFRK